MITALRAELDQFGLSTDGTREELLQRLENYERDQENKENASQQTTPKSCPNLEKIKKPAGKLMEIGTLFILFACNGYYISSVLLQNLQKFTTVH